MAKVWGMTWWAVMNAMPVILHQAQQWFIFPREGFLMEWLISWDSARGFHLLGFKSSPSFPSFGLIDILANDPYNTCIGKGHENCRWRRNIRKIGCTIDKDTEIESQEKAKGKTYRAISLFTQIWAYRKRLNQQYPVLFITYKSLKQGYESPT